MRDPWTMDTGGWSCHSCGSLNPAADDACRRCGAAATRDSDSPPSARPPMWREGELIEARYEVVRMIGQGAMGQVFEALDNDVGRRVALKRLNEELIHSPKARKRFMREARALGRVDHRNVIRLHGVFEDVSGVPVLDLELVDAGTLADRIPPCGLEAEDAFEIADALLSGLEAVHAAGLIHRDIKPSNILMTKDGTPRIADLGIAHDAGGKSLTRTGTRLGTAGYMSPEQIRGQAVSPQSDIYAFGIVLYEMLSGRVPFFAASEYDVQELQVREKPDMKPLRKKVPSAIVKVIARALEKAQHDRYASATDLRRALKAPEDGAPLDQRPPAISSDVAAGSSTVEPTVAPVRRRAASRRLRQRGIDEDAREQADLGREPSEDALERLVATVWYWRRRLPAWWGYAAGALLGAALAAAIAVSFSDAENYADDGRTLASAEAFATGSAISRTSTSMGSSTSAPSNAVQSALPAPSAVPSVTAKPPPDMVRVPAGEFWMGCGHSEFDCASDTKPGRKVTVDAFFIDRTEVTVGAYRSCVEAGVCDGKDPTQGNGFGYVEEERDQVSPGCRYGEQGSQDHPINCITWPSAWEYCRYASKWLPTEAQWEKAARGTEGSQYPWGEDAPTCPTVVMSKTPLGEFETCEERGCGTGGPLPVGATVRTAGASPYGALDMIGNVREWVLDSYMSDAYGHLPSTNPVNAGRGTCRFGVADECTPDPGRGDGLVPHVLRGGGYGERAFSTSARARLHRENHGGDLDIGFRCARPVQ